MSAGLSQITRMPGWAKAAMAVVGAAGVAAGAAISGRPEAAAYLLGGIVLVGVLLLVYRRALAAFDRRKAEPFLARLRENSAATPQGISDPSHRAQLDDMRKKFEHGLEVFREHGKDVYSMPWYLLVGEPGSGKTEMIRRCNVGFPPGLQDTLQGTGGTVNMHWWFTNHAVILDTAGKLMFEEAPPGQTTVWKDFLRQLRAGRPNCPVNGMLLVIPADTLIVDSEEQIRKKAGRIAEQLDGIQRALGVRFPVFVVITKCDKINGFREFFDGVRDPQLQHQILGWSNPSELDAAFNPELVDQHLATVQRRLRRRRLGLLIDPVHTETPDGRRIDQVDAMFAFPDSIAQVAPRLRRYLETIFVAGEWSTKPLFLRGIYFNSALREGDALDADLAAMLNIPVDALPEGKVWERERSYFIRDLLMSKVFRERGLVTRASNAKKLQRRRLGVVMGAAAVALALSIGLLAYSGLRFRAKVGRHAEFWRMAANTVIDGARGSIVPVIGLGPTGAYELTHRPPASEDAIPLRSMLGKGEDDDLPYSEVVAALAERASTPIELPPEFAWLRAFGATNPAEAQRSAARVVVDEAVIRPAIEGSRGVLTSEPFAWSDRASAAAPAIAELARVERAAFGLAGRAEVDAPFAHPDVVPLVRLISPALSEGREGEAIEEALEIDLAHMASAVKSVYGSEDRGGAAWPPDSPWAAAGAGVEALSRGVERMADHWRSQASGEGTGLAARLARLHEAAASVDAAEAGAEGVMNVASLESATTLEAFRSAAAAWTGRLAELRARIARLDAALADLGEWAAQDPDAWFEAAEREVLSGANAEMESVLGQLPAPGASVASGDGAARLVELGNGLEASMAELRTLAASRLKTSREYLAGAYQASLRAPGSSGDRLYHVRGRMYERAERELAAGTPDAAGMNASLEAIDAALGAASRDVRSLASAGEGQKAFVDAERAAMAVVRAGGASRRTMRVGELLDSIEGRELAELVAAEASSLPEAERDVRLTRPVLSALAETRVDPAFNPRAAERMLRAWERARTVVSEGTAASPALDATSLKDRIARASPRVREYAAAYFDYWRTAVGEAGVAVRSDLASWAEFQGELSRLSVADVNADLAALLRTVREAVALTPRGDRSLDEEIELEIERLDGEIRQLAGPRGRSFAERAEATRRAIAALDGRPERAREFLLAQAPVELLRDTFEVYRGNEDDPQRVAFWNNVVHRAIESLHRETRPGLQEALRRVETDGCRLPLARGASEAMTMEEFRAIAGAAARVGSLGAGASGGGAAHTVGQGATTGFRELDRLLRELSGADLVRGRGAWLAKVSGAARAIAEEGLRYEIAIPPQPSTYRGRFRYVRVRVGGETSRPISLDFPTGTGIVVPVAEGASVTLEFAPAESGPWARAVETPATWTLLASGVKNGRTDPRDPRTWIVPMEMEEDACEIAIRFNRELPPLDRWPASSEWPEP